MNKLLDYIRLRRKGLDPRKAWGVSFGYLTLLEKVLILLLVIGILGQLLAVAITIYSSHMVELEASAYVERYRANKLELAWLDCLNRNNVRIDGRSHECIIREYKS